MENPVTVSTQETITWRERVKSLIRQKNLKVTELSVALDFNRDYISRITNNPNSNPGTQNLEKIANALGVSMGHLMTGEDVGEKREEAIARVSRMGVEELERLNDYLKNNPVS